MSLVYIIYDTTDDNRNKEMGTQNLKNVKEIFSWLFNGSTAVESFLLGTLEAEGHQATDMPYLLD